MLELKDYDAYYSTTHLGTVYPGLLIEKTSEQIDLLANGLEPLFIQGTSPLTIEKVNQNPVTHSQIRGYLTPFEATDRAGLLKGTDGTLLLVSGEVVARNCKEIVKVGDRVEITECYMHNDSPAMSLFHLYSAEKTSRLGGQLRAIFSCLICYQRQGSYRPVMVFHTQIGHTIRFNPYQTYDPQYIKALFSVAEVTAASNACLKYYLDGKDSNIMPVYPVKRIDMESEFQPIISMFRNKFKAFNALLMNGPRFVDPLYEFRMGYCADAAVQGNLFIVESNMLEMWKEVLAGQFGGEIKEWSQAIYKLSKNRKGHTKRVAKAYLGTTYGSKLTLNDMEQWKAAIEKYMWRSYNAREIAKARARDSFDIGAPDFCLNDGTIDYNYALIYDPLEKFGGNLDIRNTLRSFRLTPNHKRTWEIIPFSFVVDWFVPISDYLTVAESEDTIIENQFRIKGEVNSVKMVFSFTEFPTVELVAYVRNCSTFPITKPFPNLEELNPAKRGVSGSAYINGAALILSRGKAKPK